MIRYEVQGAIAQILLDNPPVNGISHGLLDTLMARLREAGSDKMVRAIVLGSAVPGRFSGGLDLARFRESSPAEAHAVTHKLYLELFELQSMLPKPVIAAVTGAVRGGGMSIAITCDMIVAAENSTFGYPEMDVGLLPSIHFNHLHRIVGRYRAFDLLFTGRSFGATEAFEMGLTSRIAEPGTALATAHEVARVLAAKPPRVLRMAREAFVREVDAGGGYRHGVATAVENFCNVAATPESKAGIRAFVDRPRRVVDREPR